MTTTEAATEAEAVLARLAAATRAAVEVRAGAGGGGNGVGRVEGTRDGDAVVVAESGEWAYDGGRPMRWRAVSRWRAEGPALAVEHVRQGTPARAVLDRQPDGRWLGRAPHRCGGDEYRAALDVSPGGGVTVTWTVSGPCKAAEIVTRYR